MVGTKSAFHGRIIMKQQSLFKMWLSEMWRLHKDEVFEFDGYMPTDEDRIRYFRRNKWWLKNKYQGRL